ncbi:MAG: YicC/YloC family endoribonuclease [Fidelibacterota bacterium]
MTGFGSGTVFSDGRSLSVGIRSVNSRFLGLTVKLPPGLEALEEAIRKRVAETCQRGRIFVEVILGEDTVTADGKTAFDRKRFEAYASVLDTIEKEYGKKIDIAHVIDVKELILPNEPGQVDKGALLRAVDEAVEKVQLMREREGKAIAEDLTGRVERLGKLLRKIESISRRSLSETENEYRERIRNLVGEVLGDDDRIVQEAAILAERLDVTEESVRCASHLEQFRDLINASDTVGKRMNFLLQEINREVNTIGSKTNQLEITRCVVDLKDEAEKMREQVQNVL